MWDRLSSAWRSWQLPQAPFRLQSGSFGQNFVVTAAPAVAVDVPLDPNGESLVLRKTAGQQLANRHPLNVLCTNVSQHSL